MDKRYLLLSAGVEEVEETDNVDVVQPAHDLQLPVLESLVLENLLDGDHLPGVTELGLVHNTETAIANHLTSVKHEIIIETSFMNEMLG